MNSLQEMEGVLVGDRIIRCAKYASRITTRIGNAALLKNLLTRRCLLAPDDDWQLRRGAVAMDRNQAKDTTGAPGLPWPPQARSHAPAHPGFLQLWSGISARASPRQGRSSSASRDSSSAAT